MRAICLAIGRLKAGPERELVERYCQRLTSGGRAVGLAGVDLVELPESRAASAQARKSDEAERMAARVSQGATLIIFDERGRAIDSAKFASIVQDTTESASDLVLAIGGPDGFDETFRKSAQHVVSFGQLTMPHQLVRGLVLEQLYRATTILTGHPYHRS
jgi:23S rRNA (pseudouridine1915-N3)-methyltransferase